MKKALTYFCLIAAQLVLINHTFAQKVMAEEEVCIAVYPCLENGEINPIFNLEGFCGDKFRAQCAAIKTSLISDDLMACEKQSEQDDAYIASLEKELGKLRKKISRLKK